MTDLPRKILLATAGTPASDPELRAAADLSARTGAPVRMVHVGRDLPAPSHYGPDYNLFANDAEADREASRLANAQAAMIEERGGTVAEVYSQPGKRPGDEIVKNTRDEDVGLVVVGERGMGPFRYGSRTSITATVVREAFCPVLVVRGWTAGLDQEGFDQGRFPRRVLLATDGTPNAAPAAQKAVEISRGTGSELHVAHVEARGAEEGRSREVLDGEVGRIEGTGGNVAASHLLRGHPAAEIQRLAGGLGAKLFVLYVVDEHQAFHAGVHYGQFVGMLSQEGREATGRVRALAEEAGIECEEFVVFGRPQQAILAAAEELEAEPIVLGAEGMSRLQHAFVGSVSEEVLRNANRTVVVVGGHPTGGPDGSPGAER